MPQPDEQVNKPIEPDTAALLPRYVFTAQGEYAKAIERHPLLCDYPALQQQILDYLQSPTAARLSWIQREEEIDRIARGMAYLQADALIRAAQAALLPGLAPAAVLRHVLQTLCTAQQRKKLKSRNLHACLFLRGTLDPALACGRLGGQPMLPAGSTWPSEQGSPLPYIGCLYLDRLPDFIGWPRDGRVSLFGFGNAVRVVAIRHPNTDLQAMPFPDQLPDAQRFLEDLVAGVPGLAGQVIEDEVGRVDQEWDGGVSGGQYGYIDHDVHRGYVDLGCIFPTAVGDAERDVQACRAAYQVEDRCRAAAQALAFPDVWSLPDNVLAMVRQHLDEAQHLRHANAADLDKHSGCALDVRMDDLERLSAIERIARAEQVLDALLSFWNDIKELRYAYGWAGAACDRRPPGWWHPARQRGASSDTDPVQQCNMFRNRVVEHVMRYNERYLVPLILEWRQSMQQCPLLIQRGDLWATVSEYHKYVRRCWILAQADAAAAAQTALPSASEQWWDLEGVRLARRWQPIVRLEIRGEFKWKEYVQDMALYLSADPAALRADDWSHVGMYGNGHAMRGDEA